MLLVVGRVLEREQKTKWKMSKKEEEMLSSIVYDVDDDDVEL